MSLDLYIYEKNVTNVVFNLPRLLRPATREDIRELEEMLEADLSPENLTCDGELPSDQVAHRLKMLTAARDELGMIDLENIS